MLWRLSVSALLALSACAPLYSPEVILHASRPDDGSDDLSGTTGGTDATSSVTAGGTGLDTTTGGTASTTGSTTTGTTTSTTTTTTSTSTTTTGGSTTRSCQDYGTFANHPVQNSAAAQLDLVVDNANAWVAWTEATSTTDYIYASRGDRTGVFTAAGGANTAPGVSGVTKTNFYPALVLDGSHLPTVAWAGLATSGDGVFAVRLDSTNTWRALGTSTNAATGIGNALQAHQDMVIAAAVSSSGTPYVAWVDTSDSVLYVRRYKDSSWQPVGSGVVGGRPVAAPGQLAIVAPSDTTVAVAWVDSDINQDKVLRLVQWDGVSWSALGESNDDTGISANSAGTDVSSFALATQPNGLGPAVAWSDDRNAISNVFYAQWNAGSGSWTGLANSKSTFGVSVQLFNDALHPSLDLDPNGYPVIAWQQAQSAGGFDQIFMRRWNGTAWAADGNSMTNGGISGGSSHTNAWPKVRVNAGNVPVIAWQENGSGGNGTVHVCGWR